MGPIVRHLELILRPLVSILMVADADETMECVGPKKGCGIGSNYVPEVGVRAPWL